MKKILFILLCFVINLVSVNALEKEILVREYKDGYYYVMSGEKFYMSYEIPFYTLGDDIAYCIEPGTNIYTWNYIGEEGFVNSPYDDKTNSLLELIGHYGYGYFGHNTLNYRIATQALIWEVTSDYDIEFYNKQYGYGDVIDVSDEKEEIMNLVNNHYVKPSFDNEFITGYYNEEIILTDSNNVLEGYEVYSNGGNFVRIDDNDLYVKLNELGENTIKLRRKKYDDKKSIIFVGEDYVSQKVGMFRVSEEVNSYVDLNVIGAKVKVIKVDSETNENIKVSGIKFKIRNLDDNEYVCENDECIFETNEDGVVITNSILVGRFQIEELEQKFDNYLWNSNPLFFEINDTSDINDGIYEIEFSNERIKGNVEINKIGESVVFNDNTYEYVDISLGNVVYELYANEDIYVLGNRKYKKDELVSILITDSDGIVKLDNLELGKYYIKEIASSLGNMVDDCKYLFEIKKDNTSVLLELKNILPKGKLEFIKTDLDNGEAISGTLMEIYSLSSDNVVYRGYTDEAGKIIIDDLPLGKYYIKEVMSASGYENNNQVVNFEILENNDVVRIGFTNKLIFNVPDTKINEINIRLIIGISFIIIGMSGYLYVKKKY